ncbi:hypothetical protein pipiens_000228, partial [Culex pipiens pipiens]
MARTVRWPVKRFSKLAG